MSVRYNVIAKKGNMSVYIKHSLPSHVVAAKEKEKAEKLGVWFAEKIEKPDSVEVEAVEVLYAGGGRR